MKQTLFILMTLGLLYSVNGQKALDYDEKLNQLYSHTVELITPEELQQEQKNNPNIILLDSREKNEYRVSHIPGARFVGYDQFNLDLVSDIDKDTLIVVYCSLGVRSEHIGEKLNEAGYTQVKNLYGGIFEWVYQDLNIVDKKDQPTDRVHTYDENWSKWLLKGSKVY